MRLNDIILERKEEKFNVDSSVNGDTIRLTAISKDDKEHKTARMVVITNTINTIEADEEAPHYRDAIYELLKYLCKKADEENQIITIADEMLSASQKRHFQQFGFLLGKEDIRERRPGAALPIAFI